MEGSKPYGTNEFTEVFQSIRIGGIDIPNRDYSEAKKCADKMIRNLGAEVGSNGVTRMSGAGNWSKTDLRQALLKRTAKREVGAIPETLSALTVEALVRLVDFLQYHEWSRIRTCRTTLRTVLCTNG